jgi:hypothetical protein
MGGFIMGSQLPPGFVLDESEEELINQTVVDEPILQTTEQDQVLPTEEPVFESDVGSSELPEGFILDKSPESTITRDQKIDTLLSKLYSGNLSDNQMKALNELTKRGVLKGDTGEPFSVAKLSYGLRQREIRPGAKMVSEFARPIISGIAGAGGAILGSPGGPAVSALAGGGGYAMGEELADLFEEFLGLRERKSLSEELKESGMDIIEGAVMEAGGAIIGKTLGALASGGKKIAGEILKRGKPLTRAGAVKRAAEILNGKATRGSLIDKNIEEARALEELIPGLKFSRGQLTNDPEIIKFERARARMPGEVAKEQLEMLAKNAESIRDFIKKKKGPSGIEEVLDPLAAKGEIAETGVAEATGILEREAAQLEPSVTAEEIGETIRTAATGGKKAAKLKAGELFEEVPVVEIDGSSIIARIDSLSKPLSKFEDVAENIPKEFKFFKKILSESDGVVNPQDLQGLRGSLTDSLRDLQGSASPNNRKIARLTGLLKEVDQVLDTAPSVKTLGIDEKLKKMSVEEIKKEYKDILTARQLKLKTKKSVLGHVKKAIPKNTETEKVYHGSYAFEGKPSLDDYGAGEGGEGFGYGFHVTTSKSSATNYAMPSAKFKVDGKTYFGNDTEYPIIKMLNDDGYENAEKLLLKSIKKYPDSKFAKEKLSILKSLKGKDIVDSSKPSKVHVFDIPKNDLDSYLEFKLPLSKQSKSVKESLRKHDISITEQTGEDFYYDIADSMGGDFKGDKNASEFLDSIGVKGIRYIDDIAAGAEDIVGDYEKIRAKRLYNYTVFNPSKLAKDIPAVDPTYAGQKLKTARSVYKKEVIEKYSSGAVGDILKKSHGGDKVSNANIASRFFKPGFKGTESAQQFINAVGDNKNARDSLNDYIRQDLLSSATNPATGEIVDTKLKTWLLKYKPALKKLGLEDRFDSITKARNELSKAQEIKVEFDKSVASKFLKSDVDSAVKNAFSAGSKRRTAINLMRDLKGDKKAISGLQNSTIDHIIKNAETTASDAFNNPVISLAAVEREYKKFQPAIEVLFKNSPEKLKALNQFRKALKIMQRGKASPLGGGSDSAENIIHAMAAASGIAKGKIATIAKSVIAPLIKMSDDQVNSLLNRAAFDPDFAYTLQMMAKGKPIDEVEQRLKGHLAALLMRGTIKNKEQEKK